jgi:hypothetical protein
MPRAIDVLTLHGAQIQEITAFLTPDAFRGFDFPAVLPESGTNSWRRACGHLCVITGRSIRAADLG